jgi:hypothetical protein
MPIADRFRAWLVPPILVPLFLGLLVVMMAARPW